jgi:opacity protein-like surface antigen
MKKSIAIAFVLLLCTTAGLAQIPTKGNVFVGYSYGSADLVPGNRANLNGWNGSLEGKVLPWIGVVADFSGYYGTGDLPVICLTPPCPALGADTRVHSFLFGPRVSVSVGRLTPFAHALFGASHVNGSVAGASASDTSFAEALGGGVDYKLVRGLAWRFQGDYLQTRFFSSTQDNFRFSTGIVLRF